MRAPLIMICAGISYGVVQLTNCSSQQPQIKQRMVKVYVMASEGNSVVWEARNEE